MAKENIQQSLFEEKKTEDFHISRFVKSSLFSEVYLFKDLEIEFKDVWEDISPNGFFEFQDMINSIVHSYNPKDAEAWSHSETLENLIYPVLEALGYGAHSSSNNPLIDNLQLNIPDNEGSTVSIKPSILVAEDEKGKKYIQKSDPVKIKSELRKYLRLPIVTSYYGSTWDRRSNKYSFKKDELGSRGDVFSNLGPNAQVVQYLQLLDCKWGLFTDGYIWRLFRNDSGTSDSKKFLEFDFGEFYNLVRTHDGENSKEYGQATKALKFFYWFFSREGLFDSRSVVPLTESVAKKSRKYVVDLEEDLKERFVHAMTVCCNGYAEQLPSAKARQDNIKLIASTSESFIFNLLFIRSCETRGVLPIHQDYFKNSLMVIIEKLKYFSYSDYYESSASLCMKQMSQFFGRNISEEGYEIYNHLQKLHKIIQNGDNGLEVKGFLKSVFSKEELAFCRKQKISNFRMINLLYMLFYSNRENRNEQIPFNLLTPRQLGSLYESFLEFQPEFVKENMVFIKKSSKDGVSWSWVQEKKAKKKVKAFTPVIKKGEIIFSPDNKDRKTTGSYYTPDNVVQFILKKSFGDLLKTNKVKNLKKIKVCDFAMGSGHFVLASIDYLAKYFVESKLFNGFEEAKDYVVSNCVFGIDKNPSAVKLAKLSVWLDTAKAGDQLQDLDKKFICDDTLESDDYVKITGKFDLILSNPPYVKIQNIEEAYANYLYDNFDVVNGKSDLYYAFIEKGVELLKEGGVMSMIHPSQWMYTGAGKELRFFFSKGQLRSIINMDHLSVFEGATTYPCITTVMKNYSGPVSYSRTPDYNREMRNIEVTGEVEVDRLDLGREQWSLDSYEYMSLFNKLSSSFEPLKKVAKPNYGIITGFDEPFVVPKEMAKEYEREILIPYAARGVELCPFKDSVPASYLIFPYKKTKQGFELIAEKELKKKFPKAYARLKSHKKQLMARKSGRKLYATEKDWYKFYYIWDLEYFNKEKYIYRAITKNFSVGRLESRAFAGSNYPTISLDFKDEDRSLFYLGLLNSSFINCYFRALTQPLQGDSRKFNPTSVSNLLIPKFRKTDPNHKKIVTLAKKASRKEDPSVREEIDDIVEKIYKSSVG